jgi:hypothetical protein
LRREWNGGIMKCWNDEAPKDKSQLSNKPQIPMSEPPNRFGI